MIKIQFKIPLLLFWQGSIIITISFYYFFYFLFLFFLPFLKDSIYYFCVEQRTVLDPPLKNVQYEDTKVAIIFISLHPYKVTSKTSDKICFTLKCMHH